MDRKPWLWPCAFLCLSIAAGCTNDETALASDDVPETERPLERVRQDIEVLVTVPSGTFWFEVAGQCGLDGQSVYAEGTSKNAEFSIYVSRDASSGLALFFSNREDEWEILLDPAADTSRINDKNVFRYQGNVSRNHDASNLEMIDLGVSCKGS